MRYLIIALLAALSLTTLSAQADEKQATYADYNKALLQAGVAPEVAAVVSQIALTKAYEMQQDRKQNSDR